MNRRINPKSLARIAGGATVVGQLIVLAADRAATWAAGYQAGYDTALAELGISAADEGPMFAAASAQLRNAGHVPELVVDEASEAPRFRCVTCSSSWAPGDEIGPCVIGASATDVDDVPAGDG